MARTGQAAGAGRGDLGKRELGKRELVKREFDKRELGKREFDKLQGELNRFLSETKIFVAGDQKLARMESLVAALGNPQNQVPAVHIAGTSGKTSTVYFAAEFLKNEGFKVGLSVSPHIEDVRERAQINGEKLPYPEYNRYLAEFYGLVRESGILPSYFEFYMAFFYWLAARLELDYIIVEVGMGGLHDGSNVISNPGKICVITDIGLDHIEILGSSLVEIAEQKAGIIKPGNTVFMYRQAPEVVEVVEAKCAAMGAWLTVLEDIGFKDFQERNANLAWQAVRTATSAPELPLSAANVKVPARAEELSYMGKKVVLDGAHNPQKLRAFVDYAKPRFAGGLGGDGAGGGAGSGKAILVASFGANKAAALEENFKILHELGDYVLLASFQDKSIETNFRESLPFDVMEAAARSAGFKGVGIAGGAKSALIQAAERAGQVGADYIIVVGSFFLASDARRVITRGDDGADEDVSEGRIDEDGVVEDGNEGGEVGA